jgi:4-hydroxybenzoate polyprenyltransferase
MSEQQRVLTGAPPEAPAASAEARAPASTGALAHLGHVFRSLRPRQWTKNLVVFMALIFSIDQEWQLSDPSSWAPLLGWSVLAFVFLCMISSAEYLVNDVLDRESDRLHPTKRRRPIAAGLVSEREALVWAAGLAAVSLGGATALIPAIGWQLAAVLGTYAALMFAYSYLLKHIVLLDMMAISAGFVLRAMAGAVAIDVPISPWLYVVTALGALFMIIYKRRAEIVLLESGAGKHRPILDDYSLPLLDQMGTLVTASTLAAYGLYTFSAENLPDNNALMLTIPFVLYGLLRYLYLVHQRNEGGSPEEVLLRDWPLRIDIALWLLTAGIILVLYRD